MLRVFTAFSGYDSQCMALDRLGIDYELVGWSEIDKYAIMAHNAVYPQWAERNFGDISKIDWSQVADFDLFTYSSPCQDFSQAGKQAGGTQGSGTRSSLLWECERAIREKRPKYLVFENVAALISKKFIKLFIEWQLVLEGYGYSNFCKVMNAKDYGIPQNRERIFMVSILGEDARYTFPQPFKRKIELQDLLEPHVDGRYYIKDDCKNKRLIETINLEYTPSDKTMAVDAYNKKIQDVFQAIKTNNDTSCMNYIVLGWSRDEKGKIVNRHPVDCANCITVAKREGTQNYVLIPSNTQDGYSELEIGGVCDLSYPTSKTRRGRVQENGKVTPALTRNTESSLFRIEPVIEQRGHGFNKGGKHKIAPAITGSSWHFNNLLNNGIHIRKLTERECFRLMDVPEEYIDLIQASGVSRSQQYKMAGNSIVVACLYYIFDKLLINNKEQQLTLF